MGSYVLQYVQQNRVRRRRLGELLVWDRLRLLVLVMCEYPAVYPGLLSLQDVAPTLRACRTADARTSGILDTGHTEKPGAVQTLWSLRGKRGQQHGNQTARELPRKSELRRTLALQLLHTRHRG